MVIHRITVGGSWAASRWHKTIKRKMEFVSDFGEHALGPPWRNSNFRMLVTDVTECNELKGVLTPRTDGLVLGEMCTACFHCISYCVWTVLQRCQEWQLAKRAKKFFPCFSFWLISVPPKIKSSYPQVTATRQKTAGMGSSWLQWPWV